LTTVLFVSFRALGEDLVLGFRLLKKPEAVDSDAAAMVREYDSVQQVCQLASDELDQGIVVDGLLSRWVDAEAEDVIARALCGLVGSAGGAVIRF